MGLYSSVVRPLAFRIEAERAHHLAIKLGANMAWAAGGLAPLLSVSEPRLATKVAGIEFRNPIGLAAGYDKSGESVAALAALGFGSVEIGSVTIDASDGNPRPRLWRLPADRALLVHYGMQNDGARVVAGRVKELKLPVPLGINIAVTNRGIGAPPLDREHIIAEYVDAARLLAPHADYLMLNLSCPNTADGRDFFLDGSNMRDCIAALAGLGLTLPVFMKASSAGGVEAVERSLPGTVAGPPIVYRAPMACTAECYRRMDKRCYALVAAGGVTTAEDAYAKIRGGASLVQLFTAMVYEGPLLARRVALGLARLLERDGFKSVADAVGADLR
jgi:dihydroorotate dehydrogenase